MVLQFAYVPRPIVSHQGLLQVQGYRRQRAIGSIAAQQSLREGHYVLPALAQRWHVEREYVQAIEQVFAESAFGDRLLQVAVRGRHHPHVHPYRVPCLRDAGIRGPAKPGATWPGAARPYRRFRPANMVPPSASSNMPAFFWNAPVKGTALVAKQLALHEFGRQGGAIQFQKRLAGAR